MDREKGGGRGGERNREREGKGIKLARDMIKKNETKMDRKRDERE